MDVLSIPDVSEMTKAEAAVAYAEAGWRVGPLWWTRDGSCTCGANPCRQKPGKHPVGLPGFVPGGLHDFSSHVGQVRGWWRRYPEANIGLLPPTGYFALDIDDPETWEAHGVPLPRMGPRQATGTGGGRRQHLFHVGDHDHEEVGFNRLLPGTGAETKGHDLGYIVVPPSVTTGTYRWAGVGPVPPVPEELWALLPRKGQRGTTAAPASGEDCCAIPERIERDPGGYDWLRDRAAHLRARHGLVGGAARLLLVAALPAMTPPYDPGVGEAEVDRILWYDDANPERIQRGGPGFTFGTGPFLEPEDRGLAVLSDLGTTEYAEDLVRPGRIVVVSGEEGTGKSYAITGELAIRYAVAGGSFAGTWPVVGTGGVLVLSEMHSDDDYQRESEVLASLDLERADISGRYFRLPLLTAAGGPPALTVPAWRSWSTTWMREHGIRLLIVDTATGATQVKPWGEEIQEVYRSLRLMLTEYPDLAVLLLLHMRKPSGRGGSGRGLSDVMGEWGRWCDVVLMMENDGGSLERVKLTARKRVRRERRIVVTKRAGLLVDPVDADGPAGPKVPTESVIAAVEGRPGLTYAELGATLGVSKDTAARYVKALRESLDVLPGSNRSPARVILRSAAAPQSAAQESAVPLAGQDEAGDSPSTAAPHAPYRGAAVRAAVPPADTPSPEAGAGASALCGDCGAGPFLSVEFHDRHRRQEHPQPPANPPRLCPSCLGPRHPLSTCPPRKVAA